MAAPDSDSSDEEVLARVGAVPLAWYNDERSLGYDVEGRRVPKLSRDEIDEHIRRTDDPHWWQTIVDELNAKKVRITPQLLELIRKVREGKSATALIDPYRDLDMEGPIDPFPLNSDAPVPKSRFQPNKYERRKIEKIANAIAKGWIKPRTKPKEETWDLWGDSQQALVKSAPKVTLPTHAESYNPPDEYVMTEDEIKEWERQHPEDRDQNFISRKYSALRKVPAYDNSLKEAFNRSLDLFLCPRVIRQRLNLKPEELIPELPDPETLRPFPSLLRMEYREHSAFISCMDFSVSGEWLATGDVEGEVRVWDALSGKCIAIQKFKEGKVTRVRWNPVSPVLAVGVGSNVHLVAFPLVGAHQFSGEPANDTDLATWKVTETAVRLKLKQEVRDFVWHAKGDYFATVARREALSKQVAVHSLKRAASHKLFGKKSKGEVRCVAFHPTKALFFVATIRNILVYNLKDQVLVKKFIGVEFPLSMAIHVSGDHLLLGCEDCKLQWYDYDMGTTPYKTFGFHQKPLNCVSFHSRFPLFATCAKDNSVHVYHGTVHADYLQSPTIIPLKTLKTEAEPSCCQFHPKQPWLAVSTGVRVALYV